MTLFNPANEDDINGLQQAILSSQEDLRPLLDQRKECLLSYQGHRFSSDSSSKKTSDTRMSIPLMEIAIDLHAQLLAGESVRSLVSPRRDGLRPLSETIKDTLDLLIEAIDLAGSFREWVRESLWGFGVSKVGLSFQRGGTGGRGGGLGRKTSIPFHDVIDSEDVILDTGVQKWSRMRYLGNRYLVPLDWARDAGMFDAEARGELQASDPWDQQHKSASPIKKNTQRSSFIKMTELQDIYMPLDNLILTLSPGGPKKILRVEKWTGPSVGPFHLNGYEFVPDTVVPKPLAWSWMDAHDSVNVLYNKAVRQALRSKRNPLVPAGAETDADRVRKAEDGEYVPVSNPQLLQTFVVPGADSSLVSMVGQLIEVFSYMAGNINLLGGLRAQSDTLGQDKLLSGAGTRRMSDLQRRSKKSFARVLRSLAWYLFKDKKLVVRTQRTVGEITLPVKLKHEDLKGRFLEFNFDVEPIRHKSPDERLGLLLKWIREVVLPLQGQMAQSSLGIDMEELAAIYRDYADVPEMNRVFKNLGRRPSPQETAALMGRGGQPAGGAAQGGGAEGGGQPLLVSGGSAQDPGPGIIQ